MVIARKTNLTRARLMLAGGVFLSIACISLVSPVRATTELTTSANKVNESSTQTIEQNVKPVETVTSEEGKDKVKTDAEQDEATDNSVTTAKLTSITTNPDNIQSDLERIADGGTLTLADSNKVYPVVNITKSLTIAGSRNAIMTAVNISAENVTIRGVQFDGTTINPTVAIRIKASNATIDHVLINNNYTRGIEAGGAISNLKITNNIFKNITKGDNHDIFLNSTGSTFDISGNEFHDIVQVRGSSRSNPIHDVNIYDNRWPALTNNALIAFYGKNYIVRSNDIKLATAVSIPVLLTGMSDLHVSDNTIDFDGFATAQSYGIAVTGNITWSNDQAQDGSRNDNVELIRNTVKNSAKAVGVVLSGDVDGAAISENTLTNLSKGIHIGSDGYGIKGVKISNNDIVYINAGVSFSDAAMAKGEVVNIDATNKLSNANGEASGNDVVGNEKFYVYDKPDHSVDNNVVEPTVKPTDDNQTAEQLGKLSQYNKLGVPSTGVVAVDNGKAVAVSSNESLISLIAVLFSELTVLGLLRFATKRN